MERELELDIVSFEQAKILKELGFPQRIYDYLYLDGELTSKEEYDEMDCGGPFSVELSESERLSAAPLEVVATWLRKKEGIFISIWRPTSNRYAAQIKDRVPKVWSRDKFRSYEDALSAGIDRAIEIIKESHERV